MVLKLAPLIVVDVNIVLVSSPIDLKCLQEKLEVLKARLAVNAKHVGQQHSSSTQVAENDY
jgi:hypothetical protein